jgi:glycosyltransferase involved in cell wall biosynthesis
MLLERAETAHDSRVRREVRALAAAGHRVVLLHHGADAAQGALRADGAIPRRVRGVRLPGPARRIARWVGYAWAAARERPDVVHAHDLPMLLPAWAAARVSRAALVYDTHEYAAGVPYHRPLARRAVRVLERLLVPRCDLVIAVSPESAARLREDHGPAVAPAAVRNVPLLEWGEGGPVADLRAALGIGDAPLVLHQGAATAGRGCLELVGAVARVDGAHLLFLGDPDPGFDLELRAAAARAGAAARVHLRPSVPLEVLLAHTRQADAGVCLSDPAWANHRVTLSNKLFEYIAAGLPVVGTRGTAFGELIDRLGVGFTVPFGDPAALAEGVRDALAARADAGVRQRLAEAAAELNWEREQLVLLDAYARLPKRRETRQSARTTV